MSLLDTARTLLQDDVQAFWARRSDGVLKAWIYFHVLVFLVLQFAGTIPGFDLFTGVILDEIIQALLVKPAVKELWRREEAKKLEK